MAAIHREEDESILREDKRLDFLCYMADNNDNINRIEYRFAPIHFLFLILLKEEI